MINGKSVIAIVPARGGSKGLPEKNIKELAGKPLIAWTIEAAQRSRYVDRIIVSTDDDEIADVSKRFGAEVPFKRPAELAEDSAKMIEVVINCVRFLEAEDQPRDIIALLQPTSPLRTTGDIDGAIEFFSDRKAQVVVGVTECKYYPEWTGKLAADLNMKDFIDVKARGKNRQDLGAYYRLSGSIFLANSEYIDKYRDWYGPGTFAYVVEKEHSVDIDDQFDLKFAEFILKESSTEILPNRTES